MLDSPASILFDYAGNPMGVSGSMPLPTGTIGILAAGVDGSGVVRYLPLLSGSVLVTGSVGCAVTFPASQQVWTQGPVGVTASAAIRTWDGGVQGVSASFPLSVFNAGTVGVSGTLGAVIENWPAVIGVSASFPLQVFSEGNLGVTGTVGVSNFPAVQAVSGVVSLGNWPATLGVSASFPLRTWDGGVQGVSASFPLSVFNAGTVGVSGSVSLSGTGSVWISNSITVQGNTRVVGAVASGSSASTSPVIVGGADTAGVVRYVLVDPGGSVMVSTSGSAGIGVGNAPYDPLYVSVTASLPVHIDSQVQVSNFPATQAVSGTVSAIIGNWPAAIGVSGTVGVNNFPATQNVSGTVGAVVENWPATLGVSASFPLQVWTQGAVGVSGSGNFKVVGPNAAGAASNTVPVQVAGLITGTIVQNISVDPAGNVLVSVSTSSSPVSVWNQGSIGVSASVALPVWTQGPVGISASVAIRTWDGGTQGVSGTVTANVTVTGSSGLMVGAPSYNPIWVSGSTAVTNLYTGLPALSTGIAQAAPATMQDSIMWAVSLTGSLSASNGQVMPLKTDAQGNLMVSEATIPLYEDNAVGVAAIAFLPNTAPRFCPTTSGSVGAIPPATAIKASPGTLYGAWATNRNSAVRYLQLFDSTSGPSGVPLCSFAIPAASGSFAQQFPTMGVAFKKGISVGVSTTSTTYVAATPGDHDFTVQYA